MTNNYVKLGTEISQWLTDRHSGNLCFGYPGGISSYQCTCILRLTMNIYVGNLAYTVTEDDLRDAFSEFGQVDSASIINDKFSGRSKGFGFVESSTEMTFRFSSNFERNFLYSEFFTVSSVIFPKLSTI